MTSRTSKTLFLILTPILVIVFSLPSLLCPLRNVFNFRKWFWFKVLRAFVGYLHSQCNLTRSLKSTTDNSFFWIAPSRNPHTKRSLNDSFRNEPMSHVEANFLSSTIYREIDSSSPWYRPWNLNRSAITDGFGLKWLLSAPTSSSNFNELGLSGATKFFNNPYVGAPITVSYTATRFFSSISFASKNCSTRSI